ncbi:hypothetical protein [Azospirillum palustre]
MAQGDRCRPDHCLGPNSLNRPTNAARAVWPAHTAFYTSFAVGPPLPATTGQPPDYSRMMLPASTRQPVSERSEACFPLTNGYRPTPAL